MLVYGDPQFPSSFSDLQRRFQQVSASALAGLDALRRTLIQCGQLEQAVADQCDPSHPQWVQCAQNLTDTAATAFYAAWKNPDSQTAPHLDHHLNLLSDLILAETNLTVKVPEGFAFYALFPEQYCAAALDWLRAWSPHPPRHVLVIGIRSIGTTLSAVIAATLQAAGCEPTRLTVRPTGPPFERVLNLSLPPSPAEHIIIVDEGPGLSGSSMSAVADAMIKAGFSPNRISFFPGHDRGPGPAAGERVRANWQTIRQFFVPLANVRWKGHPLEEDLAAESSQLTGDLSPRTCSLCQSAIFEKMKWRCDFQSGASVLWKFVGLGPFVSSTAESSENARSQLTRRAELGWCPAPLGVFQGFIAIPWVKGRALTKREFAHPAFLSRAAAYLSQTAGPPLSSDEQLSAHQRLYQMLQCNAEKSLGPDYSELARHFQNPLPIIDAPSFSDGDLAPHNWIRTQSGALFKFGGLAHDLDHTLIGKQPLYWSVAGMLIEGQLNPQASSCLLAALAQNGRLLETAALDFYTAAYAAFRLGQATICAKWEEKDSAEWRRLQRAIRFYRVRLKTVPNPVHAKNPRPTLVNTQDTP